MPRLVASWRIATSRHQRTQIPVGEAMVLRVLSL
jgi:hypothetical protein